MKKLRGIEVLEARNLLAGIHEGEEAFGEETMSDQEIFDAVVEPYLPKRNIEFDFSDMDILYTHDEGTVVYHQDVEYQDIKPISFGSLYNEYIARGGSEDFLRARPQDGVNTDDKE